MAYDSAAREIAFGLYAQGLSKEKAVREMKKLYPGFSPSTWDEWVEKQGWRERRAAADLKRQQFEDTARSVTRVLLLELDELRQTLAAKLKPAKDGQVTAVDSQTVFAYTTVCKQMSDLAKQHMATADPRRISLDLLQEAFERFLQRLRTLDGFDSQLTRHSRAIAEMVQVIAEELATGGAR